MSKQEKTITVSEALENIDVSNGYAIKWFAGFSPIGYKKIRFNARQKQWRYEGHDGTGNRYFFAPFNIPVSTSEALSIAIRAGCREEVVKLLEKANPDADQDQIADVVNILQEEGEVDD